MIFFHITWLAGPDMNVKFVPTWEKQFVATQELNSSNISKEKKQGGNHAISINELWQNLLPYAKNKGADQPAHSRLLSTFVVRCLDSMIPILAKSKIPSL